MSQDSKKQKTDIKKAFSGEEIAIKDIFLIFWERRNTFFISAIGMFILALISVLTTPDYYRAQSSYMTEQSSSSAKNSAGVANLIGLPSFNLGGGSGNFSDPEFFPNIISSQPYLVTLIQDSLYFENTREYRLLHDHLRNYDDRDAIQRVIGFFKSQIGKLIRIFEDEKQTEPIIPSTSNVVSEDTDLDEGSELESRKVTPIVNITEAQIKAMNNLSELISISSKGKILKISTQLDDRVACAQLNQLVSTRLLEFVKENETIKERRDLTFTERRVLIAEKQFLKTQQRLAEFQDANVGVISAQVRSEEQRLESEYAIAFGLYKALATELEEKRIRLAEKMPVFTVFEPVYLPLEPASTSGLSKIVLYVFLGFFIGGLWVVGEVVKKLI